ncbi:MAG: chemotaxis protein CheA [Deltaproteobacteria bacterium]|nr:chemotaxis protein CheA [Deltaproteobacteria bacterium]MCX7952198.1 chemotaxis protein CheA [Deltaproteobacteria bacterium]
MELRKGLDLISEQLLLLDLTNPYDREEFIAWLQNFKSQQGEKEPELLSQIDKLLDELKWNEDLWKNPHYIIEYFSKQKSETEKVTSFAGEFIEKYLPELDEMSDWISSKLMEEGSSHEEILTKLKRFVHTLKGDAGCVGFHQLEKSCHLFEEFVLGKNNVADISDEIFSFLSYCSECLDEFSKSGKVLDTLWSPSMSSQTGSKSTLNPDNLDFSVFGPSANLELLKELLHDPEYSDLIKQHYTNSKTGDNKNIPDQRPESHPATSASRDTQKTAGNEHKHYTLEGEMELYSEFMAEAEDHLAVIERTVVENPENEIDLIFRSVHSIKGASGFFKFEELQNLSHLLENLLDEVRGSKRQFCENLKSCLANYVDLARFLLQKGKEFWKERTPIVWSEQSLDLLSSLEAIKSGQFVASDVLKTNINPKETNTNEVAPKKTENEKPFVKVDTVRLDHLIDSIGEMCIYTNMLVRHARLLLKDNIEVLDLTHQVEKFARELQSVGIALRLVPIKGLFQKMARLVWDLSKKTGKQIKFEMKGEETELDRNIIEKLTDPLLHMVRNCVDHGVETPEERLAKGKPREGKITLEATHKGGTIQVILKDDGKGLDEEKILAKAIERGLVSKDQKLTKEEIFSLIFMPGFSTAEKVTDLSGRGVGMDVVKRNVSDLRGRILIDSEKDLGTKFVIELPLTLAILDGILFRIEQEVYLAPTLAVVEIVDPKDDVFLTAEKGLTFNFRGQYLPLYDGSCVFGVNSYSSINLNQLSGKKVLVLETGEEKFALLVDEVLESFTTVIKSIDAFVGVRKGISGCSVMSDGSISLIVDIRETLDLAREKARGIFQNC